MKKVVLILAAAVAALALFWIGIGIGASSGATTEESKNCKVECWEGGAVVIYTDQEHVTDWGDYIVVRRE